MSIPVIYSQVTTNSPVTTATQLASTPGSILTILDMVLVNGANQLNIVSIVRTGNIAVIETSEAHPYQISETIHLENTGENNFNGKHKVFQLIDSTHLSIRVADTGATNTGAVGTIKHAAAGWTKTAIGTNQAAYHSAPFPDGQVRTIQIEDNSPYSNNFDFRVRLALGWTALNTATKISGARRYTKVNTNPKWCVIADDKTLQLFFANTTNYYIGEALGFDSTDNNVSLMSTGTEGGTYGAQFGCQSTAPATQPLSATAVMFLESPFSSVPDTFGSVSIGGTPVVTAQSLSLNQSSFRWANPISGKYMTSPIGVWEKISDAGQTHYPRARAKGISQPLGRLPVNISLDVVSGIYLLRETLVDGSFKDIAVLNSSSTNQTSASHLAVDLSMW